MHFLNECAKIESQRNIKLIQKDDRVDILSIRRIWVDTALKIFSIEVIVYTIFLIRHEAAKAKPLMETVQVIVIQLAAFMAVATGFTIILFQGVDFIMFLTQIYKERLQNQVKKARAAGIAEGKAEERHLWINWNNRRIAAEAKDEDFSEPPPVQSTKEQE